MAVVWAKSNGNWTDTTLWAFWNETTQQIEDYGQVPQVDDVVYCNGYTVTLNADVAIGNGELSNNFNPYTNISGGSFSYARNQTITANIKSYGNASCLIKGGTASSGYTLTLNGNVYGYNETDSNFAIYINLSDNKTSTINGNLFGKYCVRFSNYYGGSLGYLIVNGNIEGENNENEIIKTWVSSNTTGTGNNYYNITINGNCKNTNIYCNGFVSLTVYGNVETNGPELNKNNRIQELSVFGKLKLLGNLSNKPLVIDVSLTLGDDVYYNKDFGIASPLIIYLNDNIRWYNQGTSPFIIINHNTIADTYPTEDKVLAPTQYGAQMELVGQYTPDYPPESVVLKDYEYGDSDDPKTGTMVQEVNVEVGCVTPEDVRKDVPLVGMGVVGSLVVPSVDDVREGVIFDNGSVGTLIVQGGGDRLRIADFGYYTNAQSDTYIVDLTEQDKPKFAVAEERVLIEMFPDLDLDNIPDKYFDDLFVKYLKYRLIVEYYRTAGINSTFTPSEPTTEIVNYQNVRNEVWLNSANIYLKAWAKKYPESIVKPQRILL